MCTARTKIHLWLYQTCLQTCLLSSALQFSIYNRSAQVRRTQPCVTALLLQVSKTRVHIPLHMCSLHVLKMSQLYIASVALPCPLAVSLGPSVALPCHITLSHCTVSLQYHMPLSHGVSRCPVTLPCHFALSHYPVTVQYHAAYHITLCCPATLPNQIDHVNIALSLCPVNLPVLIPPSLDWCCCLSRGGGVGGLQHCQALSEKAEGAHLRLE